ncbi:MAG: ATP-binding protein, partial [Polyangiaceae bacterium]
TLNPKQKEYLNDVLSNGRHLLQLINDVLDLSKVEAGKMEFFPEPFSVSRAIDEVCATLAPMADKKRIGIRRSVDTAVETALLDQHKFKQVLFNLVSNAVKFTPEAGSVAVVATLKSAGVLQLLVSDTGIGIRREDFGKLFAEFQQLDSGAARLYQGTGLGLALSKKIVERQGGAITVESEVGMGSTFTVTLPLVERIVEA